MSQLRLEQVAIRYGQTTAVHTVNLQVKQGQIACLLGPSGCGKTTLLRAIAGFEPLSQGSISLNGEVISSAQHTLATEQRKIGMVFQDYALFPHLSIADNIRFGMRKQSRKAQEQRVKELLALVNLAGYERRYPHELSGGQQQRIALARALAPKPALLLLDEPFGSQDTELRESLAREVREILKQEGITALLVTHDQHEAFAMADEIGVMQAGRLQQWGSAYELYYQPHNAFVASFIGQGRLLSGRLQAGNVLTSLGELTYAAHEDLAGATVAVLIRPEHVKLNPIATQRALITSKIFRGNEYLYSLQLNPQESLLALASSEEFYSIGEQVGVELAPRIYALVIRDAN
ncbi:ABC transporter ATP-binding protein [uncultured Thiothrix sp.]|uniref:ABC transporter ATP-binding protein n=1 Tax=uncultured Thiothrix sp. TaxID=223185 RepID=UPI0026262ED6|nr:ABC transporter ATP-binding protein [uncultured Thiothrix sp.]HMT93282.1 ABC transporter ATP-binding protein [Thiolinea sp.]